MATHRFSILGHNTSLDGAGGDVFYEPWSVDAGSPVHDVLVLNFSVSAVTANLLSGSFMVPENYSGTALIRVLWASAANTNAVVWDFAYNSITDAEPMDPASATESVTVTTTVDGTALDLNTSDMTLTSGNFAAGDIVQFSLSRDGANGSDTMANDAVVFDVLFQYADA